ncbi:MAG: hypothetical protein B7Z66_06110 [Chromatiales bacterium 21-64-14]|nr:MAG: hypothetical protein B7Z66_06110 [Chromatiales bacterium 21-64-14]HQU15121.1 zinc ribbon domain-containing protein [Gammaproteobacteria bacterium]
MPIYEYQCEACGHRLETLQKMSEAPLTECPACHQPRLRKLVSAAGVQTGGGGARPGAGSAAPGGERLFKMAHQDFRSKTCHGGGSGKKGGGGAA